jgi:CRISPR type I-E-associated protein CasB/Cse2
MIDRDRCRRFASALARLDAPEGDLSRMPELGTLAHLRRGLGKNYGEASARDGWVLHALQGLRESDPSQEDWSDREIEWACCVASLFASHRGVSPDRFGAAYRKLWLRRNEAASVARRFTTLIDADARDLRTHLRHAIKLLKSEDLCLDWGALLFDVVRWDHPDHKAQRRWSRDFWLDTPLRRPSRTSNPDAR